MISNSKSRPVSSPGLLLLLLAINFITHSQWFAVSTIFSNWFCSNFIVNKFNKPWRDSGQNDWKEADLPGLIFFSYHLSKKIMPSYIWNNFITPSKSFHRRKCCGFSNAEASFHRVFFHREFIVGIIVDLRYSYNS